MLLIDKINVLIECIKHWQYMHYTSNKQSTYKPSKNWFSDCILCSASGGDCINCIMYKHWSLDEKVYTCAVDNKSAYVQYVRTDNAQYMLNVLYARLTTLQLEQENNHD